MYPKYPSDRRALVPGFIPSQRIFGSTSLGTIYNLQAERLANDGVYIKWSYEPVYSGQVEQVRFSVFVNGVFYAKTRQKFAAIGGLDLTVENEIEVFLTEPQRAESYAPFESAFGSRVALQWPDSSSDDLDYYTVYSDSGTGTINFVTPLSAVSSSEYVAGPLANGVHKFVVRGVDDVGNESTNVDPMATATISSPPDMLAALAISFDEGTGKATITWTAGTGTAYIYSNYDQYAAALTTETEPDFFDSLASVAASAATWTSSVLSEGTWVFCVRHGNDYGIESNRYFLELVISAGGAAVTYPNPVISAWGVSGASGAVTAYANVDDTVTTVNIYSDALTGIVDLVTPVASISVGTVGASQKTVSATISQATLGAGNGVYTFVARSESAGAIEETSTTQFTCLSDATAPDMPSDLTAEVRK